MHRTGNLLVLIKNGEKQLKKKLKYNPATTTSYLYDVTIARL